MTAFRKTLSGVMAFVLVFAMVLCAPLTALAANEDAITATPEDILLNAKTDGDFTYIRINEDREVEVVGYTGSDKEITVPTKLGNLTVTSVGINAFADNTTVEKIKLNSGIINIGDYAFAGCTSLKEVTKMESVTSFGEGAFSGCTAMTEFTLPDAVTAVPAACFSGNTALAEINYHKNLKDVAKDAFTGTAWENAAPDGALNFGRVLYSYKGDIKNLVIADGIEIIEDYVFIGCNDIETITFGADAEEIGLYAFQNCKNLTTVTFGPAISVLNSGAFKGCEKLTAVDFSEATIATIGYECFSGDKALSEAKFAETLTEIGDYAFCGTQVKSIELGKNVNSLGVHSFLDDNALESVTVDEKNKSYSSEDGVLYNKNGKTLIMYPCAKSGDFTLPQKVEEISNGAFRAADNSKLVFAEDTALKTIGAYAFENSALAEIVVPESVTTINNSAFKGCAKLASVTLGSAVTYIGASAFENCLSLASITLPDTLRDIAAYAFKNTGLVSADVGNGVVRLDTQAFADNKKLTGIKLGENVEKLSDGCFAGCTALTAVELPASVKSFDASAFFGCRALKTVTATGDYFKSIGTAVYSADGKTLVMLNAATPSSVIIASGTETIEAGAFDLAPSVSSIAFPASLITIKDSALDGTTWFKAHGNGAVYAGTVLYKAVGTINSLAVASGTTAISDGAVSNPTVKSVSLPDSLTRIGDYAFIGSSVAAVVVPASVTYIGDSAFDGVTTLKSVTLSKALTSLGRAAFKGCSALTSVTLPDSLKALQTDVFAGCSALAEVNLGAVETIAKYAFSGCSALKSVAIPATLTAVDAISFLDCSSLSEFTVAEGNTVYQAVEGVIFTQSNAEEESGFDTLYLFPEGKSGEYAIADSISKIADRAFYNCDALTSVIFSGSVREIGAEAFFDCDGITTVDMPDGVKKINDYAFAGCDELREFKVHSNLTDYADNTFDGCFYFNYDAVTILVSDNTSTTLILIVAVFVIIFLVWFLIYKKRQKKEDKAHMELMAQKDAAEGETAEAAEEKAEEVESK